MPAALPRAILPRAALLFTLALLAACQAPAQTTNTQATDTQKPEAPAAAPAPATQDKNTAKAALPSAIVIDDNPARLMGLDTRGLTELLGDPGLIRREAPAEIWQYHGENCVFDVFLYEEGGLRKVTYLEARDATAQRVAERACLNEILRARLAKPG